MGDVGSTQLGFILIILGIYFHNTSDLDIFYWLLLSSLFWFDATFTLIRRMINKETLSHAHKKHAYQRIVQSGFSHQRTLLFAIAINITIYLRAFAQVLQEIFPLFLGMTKLLLDVYIEFFIWDIFRLPPARLPQLLLWVYTSYSGITFIFIHFY